MDAATLSMLIGVLIKYFPTLVSELITLLKKKGVEDADFDKILARIDKDLYDKG